MVHRTVLPRVTLWRLNCKRRSSTAMWQLGMLGYFLSPTSIHWRVVVRCSPFQQHAAGNCSFCRSSWGHVPCSWAPWQLFFFFFWSLTFRTINSLTLNWCLCFPQFKWGSLRNATLAIFLPPASHFPPQPHFSSPCSPLPGNCLLAEFPGSG